MLLTVGCGQPANDSSKNKKGPSGPTVEPFTKAFSLNGGKVHPYSKFIEISGFRLSEAKSGSLRIRMNVVNHSGADLGELPMTVQLTSATADASDPALAEATVKVALGPNESREIEATVPTKLRLYELPDWQFLRARFAITLEDK
ncbi:hypothetical protein F183_A39850 [Bryobacterales bacterium F-183]|nr:hypothetical protein F183_A39850 [Bryobacterales bacterium F-183]